MEEREDNKTIIQSYVLGQWFVSTIFRRSSAAINNAPMYYETLVWRLDSKTNERGEMIHQDEGKSAHFKVCELLMQGGEQRLKDYRIGID